MLAGTALAASALVVAGSGPASAVPVDGHVAATSSASVDPGCAVASPLNTQSVAFTNRTGSRTAQADGSYEAMTGGGLAASGHSDVETTASAGVRKRAFKRLDVESTGVVTLDNDSAVACGLRVATASETEASLKVRERGRIRITWTSSVGDLEAITVTGPSGVLLSKDPTVTEGKYVVKVPPGRYTLTSTFAVAASETDVAVGQSTTTIGFYTLRATYLR